MARIKISDSMSATSDALMSASSASDTLNNDVASSSSTPAIPLPETRPVPLVTPTHRPTRETEKVFEVHRIMARSVYTYIDPDAGEEHYYLVRWEGYGPEADTWEPKHNLMRGARGLVTAYDSRGASKQQFWIKKYRSGKERTYLVRYGLTKVGVTKIDPSPEFEEEWQTREQMMEDGLLSEFTVDTAIQEFLGTKFDPVVGPAPAKLAKMSTGRHLLKVLNHVQFKRKYTGTSLVSSYKVQWVQKQKICEAWFVRDKITRLFGARAAREAVQKQREESQKPAITDKSGPSDYEAERLRNMAQNKDLLKELGLMTT